MRLQGPALLVSVYIGSADTWHGQNLAEAIVLKCRELGIAGATVIAGTMGFGATSVIHTPHLLRLSQDLPIKLEIVDVPDRIDRFLPILNEMVAGGLVTVEEVEAVRYLHDPQPGPGEA